MKEFNLDMLFKPKSIAIVGISPNKNRATLAYENLKEIGYTGKIYFVNAKYTEVHGQTCYPSIGSLPETIDSVYISIPSDHVLSTLKEASAKGAKGAVVISSGFGEGEGAGKEKSEELIQFATYNNLAVAGPNCLGLISSANHFSAYGFFFPEGLKKGNIGGVFQSGGLMHAIAGELGTRGAGISTLISSGNEMVVNSSHYIEYLANDPSTDVIMAFIEGIKDPDRFKRAAEIAFKNKKPIILVKVGKSEKAAQAAVAHTGSMTGSDKVIETMFKQKGIIRVSDVDELIETVLLFSNGARPNGNGVAITTTSGGEAGMYADLGEELGIRFTDFHETTQVKLKDVLPEFGALGNPLDTTGNAALDKRLYSACLNAIAEDDQVDLIAVSQMEITESALKNNKTTQVIVESIQDCYSKNKKPILLFTPNSGGADKKVGAMLREKGIPLLTGAIPTFKAIRNVIQYSQYIDRDEEKAQSKPLIKKNDILVNKTGVLTERESQMLLSEYGLKFPQKTLVNSAVEAAQTADKIGYPVVLKIESPDIPHKSDAGGVKLNLKSSKEVEKAYHDIMVSVSFKHPDAIINGVVVEEMVQDGVEVIAGAKVDPMFGPVVMVGSGGVLVELLQDVSLRLAPISHQDAREMIAETKLSKLLSGYRGKPEADQEALVDALVRLSHFAADHQAYLREVEINPLLVLPKGKGQRAVDGLIVLNSETKEKVNI
ncbi:acetate--CoA ligase family protein [Bacillus sp. EB106-08-02-XG196]|uniref:acetate--CoA ligase family protein n=1 Tax=Bacillus sp. EB106-08-02-XG196 TaxID=2737049 RepID=UPI0015C42E04|nr:acetate--CoA ligase family protein [Bacillus sp. EB106-08-02-XG196]NWQ43412.1 acetate--CoA ligase family protein [Bacillus sp. EB106-08-02-XG196]